MGSQIDPVLRRDDVDEQQQQPLLSPSDNSHHHHPPPHHMQHHANANAVGAEAAATAGGCGGGIAFPAGNDDFRAARDRSAQACRWFNNTPEDAPPEVRSSRWLDIIRPARDRTADGTSAAITHDMTFRNPSLKAQTPFVKPPFWVDYGLRVRIGASTFINRGCMIMDTPVADVVIGERCNLGPHCCVVSVGHALTPEERARKQDSIGKPITIGDGVWIGANVTILGGVTIGDGAVIGAGSVITRSIPPATMALGVPARVVQKLNEAPHTEVSNTVRTLTEAMAYARNPPMDRIEELELARLMSGGGPGLFRRGHSSGGGKSDTGGGGKQAAMTTSSSTLLLPVSDGMEDGDSDYSDEQHAVNEGWGELREQQQRMTAKRCRKRACHRLFRSEIMAVVAATSVAFALLTCLFFAGVLMGAKWFAIIVNSPGTPLS